MSGHVLAGPFSPLKLPVYAWGSGPNLTHGSFSPPASIFRTASKSVQPFCTAYGRDRLTDGPTDHATPSTYNRSQSHLASAAMRPNSVSLHGG